jgi:acetone carboxylase, gamma subunit
MKIQITEYLKIDLRTERWCCNRCDYDLGSARDNYKKGCLIFDRDPKSIYQPLIEGPYTFAPDSEWIRIVEFYCPGCGTMVENEFLPPGHPITYDIELDIDSLKKRNRVNTAGTYER